ncbi:hypothetical protein HDR58_03600 [bacterium]|nr:hypothetical protein [bacterium]
MTLEEMFSELNSLEEEFESELIESTDKLNRLSESVSNFSGKLDAIDKQFEEITSLQKEDYIFIVFCAALQAYRQYFVTDFKPRLTDTQAAKEVKGDFKEVSSRNKKRYYCSLSNIVSNPVPFDTSEHADHLAPGVSGNNHRWKCLGHYPVLGYVFGTANIMTSTVTVKDGLLGVDTYHVSTSTIYRNGPKRSYSFEGDVMSAKAHTDKMFDHIYARIKSNPEEGISALITALAKEHEHLRSDERSTQSLPFPVLSFTPDVSEELHDWGLDFINLKTIAAQAGYSVIVNLITKILYLAFQAGKKVINAKSIKDITIDQSIRVRCEKILSVANVVASSTNLATILVGVLTGNLNLIRKFDIGGEIVTISQLARSAKFINKIKSEYISQEVNKLNANL